MVTDLEATDETGAWLLLEQAILSDQVPSDELARLFVEHHAFARWYRERAETRAQRRALEIEDWNSCASAAGRRLS